MKAVAGGALAVFAALASGCAARAIVTRPEVGAIEVGEASYYANRFDGRPTASGELYDRHAFTAAHRTLPFGTRCRTTNLRNGRSVVVRINDRGPFVPRRIIDLSYAAAAALGFLREGHTPVAVEVVRD